jgi:hypothetical protein
MTPEHAEWWVTFALVFVLALIAIEIDRGGRGGDE